MNEREKLLILKQIIVLILNNMLNITIMPSRGTKLHINKKEGLSSDVTEHFILSQSQIVYSFVISLWID